MIEPLVLDTLQKGSTTIRNRELARVFSHKPGIVSVADDGSIRHNGREPGRMYLVCDTLAPGDIVPAPRSAVGSGDEYVTTRDLKLAYLPYAAGLTDGLPGSEEIEALKAATSPRQRSGSIGYHPLSSRRSLTHRIRSIEESAITLSETPKTKALPGAISRRILRT